MNVTSISKQLQAAFLGTVLTFTGVHADAADQSATQANNQQSTAPAATQQQKQDFGSVKVSIDNLFGFKTDELFWKNGEKFAAGLQQRVLGGGSNVKIKVFDSATMSVYKFAEHVRNVAEAGSMPRMIIGVVTPATSFDLDPSARSRVDDVYKFARKINDEYAPKKGFIIFEVIRVSVNKDDTIYSDLLKKNVNLNNAFIVTYGGRYSAQDNDPTNYLPDTLYELDLNVRSIFDKNLYVTSYAEQDKQRAGAEAAKSAKITKSKGESGGGKAGGGAVGKTEISLGL